MDWIIQLGGYCAFAGAIYGAIRQDIKALHEGVREAKELGTRAHTRIDNLLGG